MTARARSRPPAPRPPGPTLANALVLFAAVLFAAPAGAAQTRAFVVTTDFATGGLSVIDLATRAVARDVASVHSDARARWFDGRIYVVNRFGQDNIQVIDPALGYATVKQFSTGNGSNPSDIVVVSPNKAYVSLYGRSFLQIVDPATGLSGGTIDLAAFADPDGIPEADRMARVGRYLFVAVQRLDRNMGFVPTDASEVVVIDTAIDAVVDVDPGTTGTQAIKLSGKNPVTAFALDRDHHELLIGCAGRYGELDGGIVRIDPTAFADRGFAITEAALGGDVADVEWDAAAHSYAIVSDAGFNTALVTWSAVTHLKLATVFAPGGFTLSDCALDDRGELYLCDNSFTAPGIRVYSTATDAPITGPLDTGLPPSLVIFDALGGDVAGVPGPRAELGLGMPRPNPARAFTRLGLAASGPGSVAVEAFDLAGRRVRVLHRGSVNAGQELTWDLKDEGGRRVSPGIYLVRAQLDGESVTRRVAVLD